MPPRTLTDADRILNWRNKHQLTQTKAAELLGVTRQYLCAVEAGKRKPSKTLMILVSVYSMPRT